MKKVIPLLVILLLSGCTGTDGIFGPQSAKVEKQNVVIQTTQNKIEDNQTSKVKEISELSYGTHLALNKITNSEPAITVAKEMNNRVETLSGLPTIEQQTAMLHMINDLVSNTVAGKIELQNKDKDIQALQTEESILLKQKQLDIDKALSLSQANALKADSTQSKLDALQGNWGLNMILQGGKELITHIFWTLIILVVLFIVLRVLAYSNPLVNALFGIFQSLGAAAIHLIESIIPGATATLTESVNAVNTVSSAVSTVVQPVQSTLPITGSSYVSGSNGSK